MADNEKAERTPDNERAEKPYGNVAYADPGYQADGKSRYPIDTPAHVRAAWSYINQSKNAAEYQPNQVTAIKKRILDAMRHHGIDKYANAMTPVKE